MRTVAILPVKSFSRAKHRLGEAFPDRPALAAAMVADVLDALAAVPSLDGVIVVTAEPIAARIATERGVQVVHDPAERGQSDAAARGVAAALAGAGETVGGAGEAGATRAESYPVAAWSWARPRSACCSSPATARRSIRTRSRRCSRGPRRS